MLLGLYNAQGLEEEAARGEVKSYAREWRGTQEGTDTPALVDDEVQEGPANANYVKVVLLRGRMQGAVLIGEADPSLDNVIVR